MLIEQYNVLFSNLRPLPISLSAGEVLVECNVQIIRHYIITITYVLEYSSPYNFTDKRIRLI